MKKYSLVILAVLMMSGCAVTERISEVGRHTEHQVSKAIVGVSSGSEEVRTEPVEVPDGFITGEIVDGKGNAYDKLSVAQYYSEDEYGADLILEITNNSDLPVRIYGKASADKKNSLTDDTGSIYIWCIGPGETVSDSFWLNGGNYRKITYTLEVSEDTSVEPQSRNIAINADQIDNRVVFELKNTSDKAIENVDVNAIFFDENGTAVGAQRAYLAGGIGEGGILYGTLSCNEGFAEYRLSVLAHNRKNSEAKILQDIPEMESRVVSNGQDSFLILSNHADTSYSCSVSSAAFLEDGSLWDAANGYLEIIGPGETSIVRLYYLWSDEKPDHIEYTVICEENTFYDPVVGSLESRLDIGDNTQITVTNKGDKTAAFVEAYVLYFDADHNLIGADSTYVGDKNYRIRPGATESSVIYGRNECDTYEIYLSGRADKD